MIRDAWLPAPARSKLSALRQSALDADAVARATRSRLDDAERLLVALEAQDDRQAWEAARDDHAALTASLKAKSAIAGASRQLMGAIDRWLEQQASTGTSLDMAPAVPIDRKPDESHADAVGRVRQAIVRLGNDLRVARTAPMAKSQLKAKVAEQVAAMAKAGRPKIDSLSGAVSFPVGGSFGNPVRPTDWLAWLDPDAMIRAMERDIDAMPIRTDALNSDRRERRIDCLERDLLDLERLEEALITDAGDTIARRPQANPMAVLGLMEGKARVAAAERAYATAI